MIEILSKVVIVVSVVFMVFGVIGIFRFKTFYSRILISAKVETLGFLTCMFGVILHSGFTYFSLKVIVLIIIILITNPLTSHTLANKALKSGCSVSEKKEKDEEKS